MRTMDRLPAWAACTIISVGSGCSFPRLADPDQGAPTDAPTLCDPLGTFSTPVPVGGLATAANEVVGSLSPDELTIYAWGDIGTSTTSDIGVATRARLMDDFGTPIAL